MAFAMSCIQCKNRKSNKAVNIKELFVIVNNMGILSDSVKDALAIYLRMRLKRYGVSGLNETDWKSMIYELLEYCCGKVYTKIGLIDTVANQGEIIYQLKRALYVGKLKSLYVVENDLSVDDIHVRAKTKPPTRLIQQDIDKAVIESYFRELEII